jgi:outer membrane immunogenic protein
MKQVLFSGTLALVGALPAIAADMPIYSKASLYKTPPPAAYGWTGFYFGGNAGISWASSTAISTLTPGPAIAGSAPLFTIPANLTIVSALGTGRLGSNGGFTGGVQAGYNWQFAPAWLIGIEGDYNALSRRSSLNGNGLSSPIGIVAPISLANSLSTQSLATVRGRLGYTHDRLLIYGTGGVAFTKLTYSQVYGDGFPPPGFGTSSTTGDKNGWTIGGGIEFALLNNWSVRAEYLYARFQGVNANTLLCAGTCATYSENLVGATGDLQLQVARAGLNYKFNW